MNYGKCDHFSGGGTIFLRFLWWRVARRSSGFTATTEAAVPTFFGGNALPGSRNCNFFSSNEHITIVDSTYGVWVCGWWTRIELNNPLCTRDPFRLLGAMRPGCWPGKEKRRIGGVNTTKERMECFSTSIGHSRHETNSHPFEERRDKLDDEQLPTRLKQLPTQIISRHLGSRLQDEETYPCNTISMEERKQPTIESRMNYPFPRSNTPHEGKCTGS